MRIMKIKPVYLRLTGEINALDYLEKAHYFINQFRVDKMACKWAILSLHGALYGFAICACRGTNDSGVTYENKQGDIKLIAFDNALKNCQNSKMMKMLTNSKHLILSKSQRESIEQLKKDLRNNFEHYQPCAWSIEIHGLPHIFIDILDVISFLALETGNFHLITTQRRKIKSIVYQSKRILQSHKLSKEIEKYKMANNVQ